MAYLKPQSPLQHKSGDYFYPLTTADQIIMDNGSRLNTVLPPDVTSEDNGKFLRVVDGVWAAAIVQNAEEVSV